MSNLAQVVTRESAADAHLWTLPDVADAPPREGGGWHPRTLRQLEETEQRAHDEGYVHGLAEGRKAAVAELGEQVRRIDAIVAALQAPLDALDERVESELVALASIAAERIARHALRIEPARVLDVVRAALSALPVYARDVRLRLQPDDAALIRAHLDPGEGGRAWDVIEDHALARGGCIVVAEHTQIDARVETRVAAVIDELLGRDPGAPAQAGTP